MRPTNFKVGNAIKWSIRTYTDEGLLVDADSTPTVSVYKNGVSVADVVTVTKRAATTGIYDCSYDPAGEAEGDTYEITEAALFSTDSYENAWSIVAEAAERGTDNASTFDASTDTVTTDSASRTAAQADVSGLATQTSVDSIDTDLQAVGSEVSTILADTNELQQNQGDWATATGFATPSDLSGLATQSKLIQVESKVDVVDSNQDAFMNVLTTQVLVNQINIESKIDGVDANVDTLISEKGDWVTATGFATPADIAASQGVVTNAIGNLNNFDPANDVVANVTLVDTTTNLTNGGGGGGGGDATAANQTTIIDAIAALNDFDPANDIVAHVTLVDTTTDLTNQSAGGIGMFQASVRIQDSSGASLQGARVNVDGTTLSLTTGVSGEVQFNLDSGVYLLNVLPPANYDTPAGQVLTITSSDPSQTVFSLTETTPPGGCDVPWIG